MTGEGGENLRPKARQFSLEESEDGEPVYVPEPEKKETGR